MGYMDGSYNDTMREVEEECGILQSGVRFQQGKRQRTKESPGENGTRNCERKPKGTKRPYTDE